MYCQDEWIVLERRTSADLNFNQTWNIYAAGFGDLNDGLIPLIYYINFNIVKIFGLA